MPPIRKKKHTMTPERTIHDEDAEADAIEAYDEALADWLAGQATAWRLANDADDAANQADAASASAAVLRDHADQLRFSAMAADGAQRHQLRHLDTCRGDVMRTPIPGWIKSEKDPR